MLLLGESTRKFYLPQRKIKSTYFVIISIILLLILLGIYLKDRTIFTAQFSIFGLFLIINVVSYLFKIYTIVKQGKSKVPDIEIGKGWINFAYGTDKKILTVKVEEITNVYIPKWDDLVEITCNGLGNIAISLEDYSEEEHDELKKFFQDTRKELGLEQEEDKDHSKSYHIVNGNLYKK